MQAGLPEVDAQHTNYSHQKSTYNINTIIVTDSGTHLHRDVEDVGVQHVLGLVVDEVREAVV